MVSERAMMMKTISICNYGIPWSLKRDKEIKLIEIWCWMALGTHSLWIVITNANDSKKMKQIQWMKKKTVYTKWIELVNGNKKWATSKYEREKWLRSVCKGHFWTQIASVSIKCRASFFFFLFLKCYLSSFFLVSFLSIQRKENWLFFTHSQSQWLGH